MNRAGICSEKSEILIHELERDLPTELARLFNVNNLNQLATEEDRFKAVDSGDTDDIGCAAEYMFLKLQSQADMEFK